jgi:hypothetical protein
MRSERQGERWGERWGEGEGRERDDRENPRETTSGYIYSRWNAYSRCITW